MGHALGEASSALSLARDRLLTASQQAGSDGDWENGRRLFELARRADELARAVLLQPNCDKVSECVVESPKPLLALDTRRTHGRPESGDDYPRYLTKDDYLIKRGLQRGGADVYEHAVPRAKFDEILGALTQLATGPATGRKGSFDINRIQKRLACPQYMTYVVVSLLLKEGLLIRFRKGSYTFADPATFAANATNLWDQLKEGANA
jgi:hypothetical protein